MGRRHGVHTASGSREEICSTLKQCGRAARCRMRAADTDRMRGNLDDSSSAAPGGSKRAVQVSPRARRVHERDPLAGTTRAVALAVSRVHGGGRGSLATVVRLALCSSSQPRCHRGLSLGRRPTSTSLSRTPVCSFHGPGLHLSRTPVRSSHGPGRHLSSTPAVPSAQTWFFLHFLCASPGMAAPSSRRRVVRPRARGDVPSIAGPPCSSSAATAGPGALRRDHLPRFAKLPHRRRVRARGRPCCWSERRRMRPLPGACRCDIPDWYVLRMRPGAIAISEADHFRTR